MKDEEILVLPLRTRLERFAPELQTALFGADVPAAALGFSRRSKPIAAAVTGRPAERPLSAAAEPAGAGTVFRGIDAQRAPAQLMSVETLDRLGRIVFRLELHERKAAGTAGLPIRRQEHVADRSDLREQVLNLRAGGVEIEVSYKYFRRHSFSTLSARVPSTRSVA
jgi:hypothetical protein